MNPATLLLADLLPPLKGAQSALDPSGPTAAAIARLSWIMIAGGGAIFIVVMALVAYAAWGGEPRQKLLRSQAFVIGGGLIFPILTLSLLLPYGLSLIGNSASRQTPVVEIDVTGNQFWWRVRYAPTGTQQGFETANEIRLPVGEPVTLRLRTDDVIHSFWVPNLAGKLDMIPGKINTLTVTASEQGIYRGQCAEFCGSSHAWMALEVVALPRGEFETWRASQARDSAQPSDPFLKRGQELFVAGGCGSCHTVRGIDAQGALGPDLTHIGSRRRIAAATFPTHAGTLAGWVAGSQTLKPGNKMPSFDLFTGEELRALASYLESLR